MKHLSRIVLSVVIISLAFTFSCEREKAKPTGKKTVEVTFVSPQGPVYRPQNIVVSFNKPMVAITSIGKTKSKGPIKLTPEIDGAFHWLGTQTVSFVPSKPFPFATGFSVTIDPDVIDINGDGLAKPMSWTFETAKPEIVSSKPGKESNEIEQDTNILVAFNQPVDPTTVAKHLKLTAIPADGKTVELASQVRRPSENEWKDEKAPIERTVIIDPAEKLPMDANVEVTIGEGFIGSEGPLTAGKPLLISFHTLEPLKVEKIDCMKACDPRRPISIEFNNRVSPKDVVQHITIEPAVEFSNDADWNTSWLELYAELKPKTTYTITLKPDLTDMHGLKLGTKETYTYTTDDYSPSLSLVTGNGVLEADGPKEIGITTTNITSYTARYARIEPEDVVAILTKDILFDQYKQDVGIDWSDAQEMHPKGGKNQTATQPLSLADGLSDMETGILLLDVSSNQVFIQQKNMRELQHFRSLIQVTDIGITGKSYDDGMLIWTTSLAKGAPMADVELEVRTKKNDIIWEGTTDAKGLAKAKIKRPEPDEVLYIFARNGSDVAYSTSFWNGGFTPWDFGIWNTYADDPLTGYVFTERGIYKPGESIRLKAIVRNVTDAGVKIVKGLTGTISANDDRGREYFNSKVSLSEFGTVNADIPIPLSAATGTSSIEVTLTKDGKKDTRSFHKQIIIAEYKPAEFKLTMTPKQESVVAGEQISVDIEADYLFGEPMKNAQADWSVFRQRASFDPEGFENYAFGSRGLEEEEEFKYYGFMKLEGRTKTTLDKGGDATITVPTKKGTVPVITNYVIESTVTDINQRTISDRSKVTVNPGDFYVGINTPSFIISAGQPFSAKFVSVDTEGKQVAGKGVTAKLIKREWHSVKKKAVVGYTYESKPVDVDVASCEVKTAAEPVACQLTAASSGLHIIQTSAKDGSGNPLMSEAWLYATGAGEAAWKPEDHDRIELIPDKKKYAPDETATILVKSPFESARALITYEQSGVIFQETRVLKGYAPEIKVPLTDKFIPNVYVSVVLVTGRIAKDGDEWGSDPGRPRIKVGYVNIPVSPKSKKLDVGVSLSAKRAGPGDTIDVTVSVKDNKGKPAKSELAIMAVDTGSLILTGYTTPDPFDTFYAEKALGVMTSDSRIHLIGRRQYGLKGEAVGGGGAAARAGPRTKFLTVAYWNPSIVTNEDGTAKVSFKLPDNLTTYKVMAVAATDDTFGSGDAEVISTKPFLVRANLPYFAALGDTFFAGVVVQNNRRDDLKGTITATAEGIELKGDDDHKFTLGPKEKKEMFFTFKADKVGVATLIFNAGTQVGADGLKLPLDIRITQPKEVFTTYGETRESAKELFEAPKDVFKDVGGLDVSLASTAMVGLTDASMYLINYPYECIEQKVSKAIGMMIYDSIAAAYGMEMKDPKKYRLQIENTIFEIYRAQDWSGGISFWPGLKASPYLTVYATQFMQEARALGYAIDAKAYQKAKGYLHNMLRWDAKKKGMNAVYLDNLKAYAVYVLARTGEEEPGYAESLYAKRDTLSLSANAQLILALKMSGGVDAQFNEFVKYVNNRLAITAAEAHVEADDTGGIGLRSTLYTDAYVLSALMVLKPDHPLLPKMVRYLMNSSKRGFWVSTHTTAAVLSSLYDYIRKHEQEEPDFTTTVALGAREILKATFKGRSTEAQEANVPMTELLGIESPAPLTFTKDGKGLLYYRTRFTYAPSTTPLPPMEEGFTIYKTMEHYDDDKKGKDFKRGDIVKVRLEFVVPAARNYVVINDGLPAGLEAVNFSLTTAKKSLTANQERDLSIDHVETYGDRVLIFANRLDAGSYRFDYVAKASTKGEFTVPPAQIEEMYNPEVFGRTATSEIEID